MPVKLTSELNSEPESKLTSEPRSRTKTKVDLIRGHGQGTAASGVVTDLSVGVINKHPDFKADIAAVPVKLTSESTPLPSAITIESTVRDGDNLITAAPIKAAACVQITSSSQMFDNHLTQYAEVNAYVNTYRVFFRDKYFLFHFEGTKIMYYIEKNNDSH